MGDRSVDIDTKVHTATVQSFSVEDDAVRKITGRAELQSKRTPLA